MIRKAGLIATRTDGNGKSLVLMVRKRGHGEFLIPGGRLEEGEDFPQALFREIHEELECRCKITRELGEVDGISAFERLPLHIRLFEGELCGEPRASSEIEEVRWLDLGSREVPLTPITIQEVVPLLRKLSIIGEE